MNTVKEIYPLPEWIGKDFTHQIASRCTKKFKKLRDKGKRLMHLDCAVKLPPRPAGKDEVHTSFTCA